MRKGVLLALFFASLPAGSWASDPKPARGMGSFATFKSLNTAIKGTDDDSKSLVPFVADIITTGEKLPDEEQRDQLAEKRLSEFNAKVSDLGTRFSVQKPPSETAKTVQNAAAYLNNRAERFDEGRDFSNKVLAYDPNDRDALLNRSNASYGLKEFKSAYTDADKAAKLDPQDAGAYTARALAAYGMKDYLQTLEDSRRALALDRGDKTAFSLLKLAEGRVPALEVKDEKSRAEAEVQQEYHGMVAQLNQVEEKRKELPTAPSSPAVDRLVRSAAAKISLKDYNGALDDAGKALDAAPDSAAAFYYKASAYNLLGRYEEAAANASLALSLNPNDVASRDARAWSHNHLGRYNEAIADSNHSLELDPSDPYAYANRGFAHEKLGDLDAMVADLQRAANLNAQFEPVYRDAMAMHSLSAVPDKSPQFRAPLKTGDAPPAPDRRGSQFLVVLASSVIGGFLIALGLLHVMSTHWAKKVSAEVTRAHESQARKPRAPSGIDASYVIGPSIGRGGMGVVFEAHDRALQRKVAIKVLRDEFKLDVHAKERFLEEARTVAALHHPSIVDIHSIVEDEAGLYLVFEHISGKTLDELITEKKRFSLTEAKSIMKHVCQALEFAHERGVVHRDLKPGNIMITDTGQVKVMDFGISRQAKDIVLAQAGEKKYSITNNIVGTPYYMSPEQEYGVVRRESDIFSLGACLYEMLTGERPYPAPANTPVKLAQSYVKPSRLAAGLPPQLDAFIDGALAPDPEKRIHTAKDFWSMLERVHETPPAA